MKKVWIHVTNDLSYDQRMNKISQSLQREGYDVTLLGRELPRSIPLKNQIFNEVRVKCWFNRGFLFYLEINVRFFLYLYGKVGEGDIIHMTDFDTMLAAIMLRPFRKTQNVYDAHEYYVATPELLGSPLKRRIWNMIGKRGMKISDINITVNKPLAEELERVYGYSFHVIKNVPRRLHESSFVDKFNLPTHENSKSTEIDLPSTEVRVENKILLYQGALNMGRGIEAYIECLQYLPDYTLYLIGDGPETSNYKELVQKTEYVDRIVFKGYVLPDELREIGAYTTIGLNLLERKSDNYYFSLANKFFDYMLLELPSINMNFPPYREVLEDFHIAELVDDLDSYELSECIKNMTSISSYNRYREECRRASCTYNWEEEEKVLLGIYSELTE